VVAVARMGITALFNGIADESERRAAAND
jgi:hypothetical protein